MTNHANSIRYGTKPYRSCGRRGLKLPAVSLGLWHNFGDAKHQPSYSLLNRWIEEDLLDAQDDAGMGGIAFSALAGAPQNLQFYAGELPAIDQHAVDGGSKLWQRPSTDQRPA